MVTRLAKRFRTVSGLALLIAIAGGALSQPPGAFARSPAQSPQPPKAAARPNIVLIVADDLGFSDLGAFGGEIRTPNLDRLANSGLRLTNFHTGPQCTVTRSMLLSGTDNHLVGYGGSAEHPDPANQGKPGYEGYLNDRAASIADLLHRAGYYTVMAGKWHQGARPESWPSARGFERSFALIPGAHNHFGFAYPGEKPGAVAASYKADGQPIDRLPADFYSSDTFTSELIARIDAPHGDRPFFAYLPFSAPHWPLQAPAEDIARYKGRYDGGWARIRTERIARLRQLGLMKSGERAHDPLPPNVAWDRLTPDQRAIEARKMEVYAAMVDRLDQNVGRLVAHLKATGQYENTIFVFMADNGAEALAMEQSSIPANAENGRKTLARGDNSVGNMGAADSSFWYGPDWGQVSSAPGFRNKHYATEGGTRVVAFVTQPGQARVGAGGQVRRTGISGDFISVYDIAPTLLEWAGVVRGADGRLPFLGTSAAPYLAGLTRKTHLTDPEMGIEFRARRSYRIGDWKIVLTPTPEGSGRWELYDLSRDPNEIDDLAARNPAKLRQLEAAWDRYAREFGVILPSRPGI